MKSQVDVKLKETTKYILAAEFVGMFFIGLTTVFKTPIGLTVAIAVGSTLIGGAVMVWSYLVFNEVAHWLKVTDRISRKKVN